MQIYCEYHDPDISPRNFFLSKAKLK